MNEIDQVIERMIQCIESAKKGPPPAGKGATRKDGSAHVRLGRLMDGRYYVECAYPVPESYDDDYESMTCQLAAHPCPLAGTAHEHVRRIGSGSLASLRDIPTESGTVIITESLIG